MSGIKTNPRCRLAGGVGEHGPCGRKRSLHLFRDSRPVRHPEALTKNDIYVFGGVFADGSFGSVVQFWDTDYTDNFMIDGIYGRNFKDLGAGFVLGGADSHERFSA